MVDMLKRRLDGMRHILAILPFIMFFLFSITPANASTNISDCAALDTVGETYYLTADVITATTPCMHITANNVTLDCQGHLIEGFAVPDYGIRIEASRITVRNCDVSDFSHGILIYNSEFNNLTNMTTYSNTNTGLNLYYAYNNTITDITAYSNSIGVVLYITGDNTILNSTIKGNANYGIDTNESNHDLIYYSLFNNSANTLIGATAFGYWNYTGLFGGNYWTNPYATGYSDLCADIDVDGFCDMPYDLESNASCTPSVNCSNNTDYMPYSGLILQPPTTTTTTTTTIPTTTTTVPPAPSPAPVSLIMPLIPMALVIIGIVSVIADGGGSDMDVLIKKLVIILVIVSIVSAMMAMTL